MSGSLCIGLALLLLRLARRSQRLAHDASPLLADASAVVCDLLLRPQQFGRFVVEHLVV
ncbi:MAG: hypothetical protein AB8G26_17190 [Ilumatobacter sp.]